jgi:hypothetical protein
MKITREDFLERFNARRDALSLSRNKVKVLAETDVIRDMERDKTYLPRCDDLASLCRVLKVSMADLLYGSLENLKNDDYESHDIYNQNMKSESGLRLASNNAAPVDAKLLVKIAHGLDEAAERAGIVLEYEQRIQELTKIYNFCTEHKLQGLPKEGMLYHLKNSK